MNDEKEGTWQPIETAPKDGTSVLVVHDETIVSEATFDIQDDNWWLAQTGPHDFDPSHAIYPTHWMPLPAAPKRPFHGSECSSYPNCNGGCGLGCTKEMESAPTEAAKGYADSLRQQADWIEESREGRVSIHQRIDLGDIDLEEIRAAADFIEANVRCLPRDGASPRKPDVSWEEYERIVMEDGAVREALQEAIDVFEGMNDDEISMELLPRLRAALARPAGASPRDGS